MGVRVPVQLAQRSSRLVLAALAIALPMLLVPVSSADASTSASATSYVVGSNESYTCAFR